MRAWNESLTEPGATADLTSAGPTVDHLVRRRPVPRWTAISTWPASLVVAVSFVPARGRKRRRERLSGASSGAVVSGGGSVVPGPPPPGPSPPPPPPPPPSTG